jgi:hypothetical protein
VQILKKKIVYSNIELNENLTYYQVEDDCEDFKVFINEKKEVFLLKNKIPSAKFFTLKLT